MTSHHPISPERAELERAEDELKLNSSRDVGDFSSFLGLLAF